MQALYAHAYLNDITILLGGAEGRLEFYDIRKLAR